MAGANVAALCLHTIGDNADAAASLACQEFLFRTISFGILYHYQSWREQEFPRKLRCQRRSASN
jgi:hypothetical protein